MIKNKLFFRQLQNLLIKVLPVIEPTIKRAYFPTQLDKYPNLKYQDNGFPTISTYPSIIDVGKFFRDRWGEKKATINLEDYVEYNELFEELQNNPEFVAYYHTPLLKSSDNSFDFRKFYTEYYLENFIEHYYYLFGAIVEEEKVESLYGPLENFLYSKVLYFDIGIPILFLQFDVERFELAPNIFLRRIDDKAQRARYKITERSPSVVEGVFMSATHELVLTSYSYERPANWLDTSFSQANIYPTNIVETFLTVLKIATNCTSGFAQFIIYPKDWAISYSGDLMYITGAATKNYPTYFDDYYWNYSKYSKVVSEQLEMVSTLFRKTLEHKENKLDFALRRFYKSIMRQEEEDVIIDLIIALEILLGDAEKNEITHKLSLRLAALLSHRSQPKFDARQVFKNMKQIYAYRSSIVHGSHTITKKREIKLEKNTVIPTVSLAADYLREVLKIIILEPKYLNPSEVDDLLLKAT